MSIVETASGKVRGQLSDDVYAFRGIPYAASTAGAGRFMPPKKPLAWQGVRNAIQLAAQCPQLPPYYSDADTQAYFQGALEPLQNMSEDCLAVNVWTPTLDTARKCPVMVWCHGGAYEQGSGGSAWDDGSNLARLGDVVVVTLNHRLNVFGHLYLRDLGDERYRDSGNAGMLDIVSALEWVRDNISAFGGDPNNITLFGQSGGGFKISALLAMPCAKGLFHKAIIQSGSALRMANRDDATRASEMFLAELDIKPSQLHKLNCIAVADLHRAMASVQRVMGGPLGLRVFCPVVDGAALPMQPIDSIAAGTADIPLLIGTTQDETRSLLGAAAFSLEPAALALAIRQFTELSDIAVKNLIDIYRAELPSATASDLYFAITTDYLFRASALRQAEWYAQHGRSPLYMYQFAWQVPTFSGKFKAAHAADEPFVFGNLHSAPGLGGISRDSAALSERMMRAWTGFAHSGNPNHNDLPQWPRYTGDMRASMIFDTICRIDEGVITENISMAAESLPTKTG